MPNSAQAPPKQGAVAPRPLVPARRRGALWGDAMIWLCGGALSLNLLLVLCLLGLLAVNGLSYFWQKPLVYFEFKDGKNGLGEIYETEAIPAASGEKGKSSGKRYKIRFANIDFGTRDFEWIDENAIIKMTEPPLAAAIERFDAPPFFGFPKELKKGNERIAGEGESLGAAIEKLMIAKAAERENVSKFELGEIAPLNHHINDLRLQKKKLLMDSDGASAHAAEIARIDEQSNARLVDHKSLTSQLVAKREALEAEKVVVEAASGARKEIPISNIARFVTSNSIGTGGRLSLYFSRVREFLFDDPRNLNTEGGIFPAIFGTVFMVFLMSFAVVPFGVLAALYLREYAKQGAVVRLVRIAVNNLAGVPSIVFGMFGLGFFVYTVGGTIDQLFFAESLPAPTFGTGGILWASLTLALLTVPVVIVASEEGLASVPRIVREGSLALGATKFETTWRVVLPAAAPGILTGVILAMARAAGEVAPLMIVGMVKLASALPVDGTPPFIHPERKFMHLGFHIYDIGFQNKNVDATKPLVFATAFLLIAIVTIMNLIAISLRNRLRRKYAGASI